MTPSSATRSRARASVRLVGDDQQLASISTSGVISDIAARHETLTLSTVVRSPIPASAASLAMREGDPAGIAYYIDHRRVHVGADQNAADMAYAAWAADIAAGRDSILLAPTNEQVAELNERARLDRLTNGGGSASATVTLGDGLTASAGDWIATRKNARWLRLKASNGWVKNGHRWVIRRVHRDGSVTVSPLRGRAKDKTVRLPADYIAAHTTLGYACTIDSAQGVTAGGRDIDGTCHIVGSDRLTRQQLYVRHPRQKRKPHLLSTAEADPHRVLAPKATHPPPPSTSSRRSCAATAPRCPPTAPRPPNPIRSPGCTPRPRCTPTRSPQPPNTPPARPPWPTSTPPPSRSAPTSPTTAPGRCCGATWPCWPSMATTRSRRYTPPPPPPGKPHRRRRGARLAAADTARVGRRAGRSAALAGGHPDALAAVGPLPARAPSSSAIWPTRSAPPRANGSPVPSRPGRALLAEQPQLMAEIAVFRAAHDVDVADTRITGPEQHANRSAAIQQFIHGRVDTALRRGQPGAQRWRSLAEGIDAHISADPFWPRLATHLDAAARAGADVSALLTDAVERHGPLPDELPAAALWWRLAGTLEPPTLAAANTGCARPGHPNCTACSARASPKPSSPTRRGHRWSPPSPPPDGNHATCSPPPNTCATSTKPSTCGPTNTPAC